MMKRADQHTQHQIADLVGACAGYWALRGITREHITEMRLELEQHLQQAVSDGKSLEAVLGPHPLAFAEAWAREMHPRVFRGGAAALRGLVYVLSIVSTTALLSQLLVHSSAFTFSLFAAYLLIGSGLLALLLQLGGFLAPRISTRTGRETLLLDGELELARDYCFACPGCGTVLPGLLADLHQRTYLYSFRKQAGAARCDDVCCQCRGVRRAAVRRQCSRVRLLSAGAPPGLSRERKQWKAFLSRWPS